MNYTDQSLYSAEYGFPNKTSLTVRLVLLPIITVSGFIGNILASIVFLGKSLKNKSCSIYLACKSISDNGFLLTLFIAWLDFVGVRIFHVTGVCQIVLYLSYVCGFLSVWCVVMVTMENYIRICKHSNVMSVCTQKVAKRSVFIAVLFACLLYCYPLWSVRVMTVNQTDFCETDAMFFRLELAMTYVDTVLTLVFPFLIIFVLMIYIGIGLRKASKRKRRLSRATANQTQNEVREKRSANSSVTKLLISVTLVFIILHTPSHVIRSKVTVENLLGYVIFTSDTDRLLQQLFLVLYYLNFSVYILIYIACGQNFRKVFCKQFKMTADGRKSETCVYTEVKMRDMDDTKDTVDDVVASVDLVTSV